ncbi:hypothetical protein [Solidesulfovibrio sp.]|uniref:hypothetical protein n=1 Tax=Solidesulfovibrio sp. TaxID=2910990 RepID=UPI002602B36E|nr:hypothetical protein [Solidesulfovibrio sp.]
MTEICHDPLRYLVERLCCQVYLDGGGNVRLGFSRRHDLTAMMTAQGIARSNAGVLRERLRQDAAAASSVSSDASPLGIADKDASWPDQVAHGAFCPLI